MERAAASCHMLSGMTSDVSRDGDLVVKQRSQQVEDELIMSHEPSADSPSASDVSAADSLIIIHLCSGSNYFSCVTCVFVSG